MKLSIIIPIYNVEDYLDTCLDSVVSAQSTDYEIIAVNDGSKDSSPEILSKYQNMYPNLIRRVDKENGGLGSARNAGLDICEGEYVLFLDSDDSLATGAIDEIIATINSNSFDICFFDQQFINMSGKEILRLKGCESKEKFSFDTYPEILFYTPNAGNKIFRTGLFTENGISFPPRQWFEDVNSIYLLYPHAESMMYVPKAWNVHLQRTGSITNSKNTYRNIEMITALEDLYNHYSLYNKLCPELEYCIFYNGLLTSIDRVNLIDKESDVQDKLLDYFINKFPEYEKNKYIKTMPLKYRLLFKIILARKYKLLNMILRLNSRKYE